MAVSTRWMLIGALFSTLVVTACGGGGDGGGGTSKPSVDAGNGAAPLLVGAACVDNAHCATGSQCRQQQGFGALSTVLSVAPINAPGGYCSADCTSNAECGTGGVCLAALAGLGSQLKGECRHGCKSDTDCRDGYECATSAPNGGATGVGLLALPASCQAKPEVDHLVDQVGKSCDKDGPSPLCGEGFCTGTYCSGACNVKDDSSCGAKAVCVSNGLYGSGGTCEQTCAVDTDCTQYTPGGDTGCVDSGKGTQKVCGLKRFPLDPNVVGNACSDDRMCGSYGTCANTLGVNGAAAPGGYCTLAGCQDDTECGGGACVGVALISACYVKCSADTQCRPGYTCQDKTTPDMTMVKVCAITPVARDGGVGSTPDGGASSSVDAGVADAH